MRRLWVRISAPDTGWTFFTLICCKIWLFVWKDRKKQKKDAEVGQIFFRNLKVSFLCHCILKHKCFLVTGSGSWPSTSRDIQGFTVNPWCQSPRISERRWTQKRKPIFPHHFWWALKATKTINLWPVKQKKWFLVRKNLVSYKLAFQNWLSVSYLWVNHMVSYLQI